MTVGVKSLVWIEIEDDDCDFEAFASGQRYWIVSVTDHQHTVRCSTYEIGDYLTVEKAKAAAQADYEARIRAALEPVAAPDHDVVEIDLRAAMMGQIEEAASQSPWVPPEYMMNEIISDCCTFLREARAPDPAAIREAIKASVGECLAGLIHAEVSKDARRKIERAIDNALIPTKGAAE